MLAIELKKKLEEIIKFNSNARVFLHENYVCADFSGIAVNDINDITLFINGDDKLI